MQLQLLMHIIFLVQFTENYFQLLSIVANLNVTSGDLIICSSYKKMHRGNGSWSKQGLEVYPRFLSGVFWLDSLHRWGEACNRGELCWRVSGSGK